MRLYLFPITRSRTLIYCKRNLAAPPRALLPPSSSSSSTAKPGGSPATATAPAAASASKPSIVDRVTARANQTWIKWESERGGWKKKVTGWGNQAFARIAYEEWGLKSIPPLSRSRREEGEKAALAKKKKNSTSDGIGDVVEGKRQEALRRAAAAAVEVDVVYPAGLLEARNVRGILKQLTRGDGSNKSKKSEYRRRIWWSVLAMPLTLPFMLVPVVPNLPFFYLVFRAWSLWRAQAGCAHVEHLLANDLLNPTPSPLLRAVYNAAPVSERKIQLLAKEVERLKEERGNDEASDHPDTAIEHATMQILGGDGNETNAAAATAAAVADSRYSTMEKETLLYPKGHGKAMALALNMPELEVELERAHDQVAKQLAKEEEKQTTPVHRPVEKKQQE